MIIKASGRAALILTAGLLVLCASPVMATDGNGTTTGATSDRRAAPGVRHRIFKHALHHRRHYVHRRDHAVARAADEKAVDEKAATPAVATNANRPLPEIPPSVANANAQMLLAGAQISAAAAIPPGRELPSTTADVANVGSEITVAASDQLNDTDRNLQESSVTATTSPPPATATSESSSWDQASLIGKIFIGFGALLTMASAARMFIT